MVEVSRGRILLDPYEVPQEKWSNRSSWISGSESAYALLAKFAALNVLSCRELCELFVIRKARKTGAEHFPKVDLRSSEWMRTGRLGNLFAIDAAELRLAFVNELFPNASSLSSNVLVWCPRCAHHGFHSAAFQLNFYLTCPVHRIELRRACHSCKAPIPYVLHSTQSRPLFVCLSCGRDLAGELRKSLVGLALDKRGQALHRDHIELVRFTDTLPTLFNACRSALGRPNLPIEVGKADVFRSCGAFRQFVADVLTAVSARVSSPQLHPLRPTGVFSHPFEPPPRAKRGAAVGDQTLDEATSLYRCLRRSVYRHHCRGHAQCIRAAMKTMWWDPEGERVPVFCPTAQAFLRWRMHWEGCRIPSELDRPSGARTPYGLIAWLASEAPIGSRLWAHRLDGWVRSHLLACACLDSFAEWLQLAERAKKLVLWHKADAKSFRSRHWACSGRGTTHEPAMLFIEHTFHAIGKVPSASGAHLRATRSALSAIRR